MNGEPPAELDLMPEAAKTIRSPGPQVPAHDAVRSLQEAQRALQDTSPEGVAEWVGMDEIAVARKVNEIIAGNDVKDVVGRVVLNHFREILIGAAEFGMRAPSGEVLSIPGAEEYYRKVFELERVIFTQVEDNRDNPQALEALTRMIGSMDALVGALADRYKAGEAKTSWLELEAIKNDRDVESGFEAFANRFQAFRGLMAVAFSLQDAGYQVALGDRYQDLALGMDLVVYANELDVYENRPCMFIDAKSQLGIEGESHSGVRAEDYRDYVDKKHNGRGSYILYTRRLEEYAAKKLETPQGTLEPNQFFTQAVPHLVVNYPRRDYFANLYENSTLGLPKPDQAHAVVRVVQEAIKAGGNRG